MEPRDSLLDQIHDKLMNIGVRKQMIIINDK